MHDIADLERRGVVGLFLASEAFAEAARSANDARAGRDRTRDRRAFIEADAARTAQARAALDQRLTDAGGAAAAGGGAGGAPAVALGPSISRSTFSSCITDAAVE